MKKKMFIIFAAAAVVAGGSTATKMYAADDAASPRGRAKSLQHVTNQLELTSERRSQIRGIFGVDQDYLEALIGQLHEAKANLRDAIRAGDATKTSVCTISSNSPGRTGGLIWLNHWRWTVMLSHQT